MSDDLESRGSDLHAQLTSGRDWDAANLTLITEACRLADRLDKMHALLRGEVESWAWVSCAEGGITIQVDRVLSEARQHAATLARILGQLQTAAPAKDEPRGSKLDDLSAARARRGAATSDPGYTTGL